MARISNSSDIATVYKRDSRGFPAVSFMVEIAAGRGHERAVERGGRRPARPEGDLGRQPLERTALDLDRTRLGAVAHVPHPISEESMGGSKA